MHSSNKVLIIISGVCTFHASESAAYDLLSSPCYMVYYTSRGGIEPMTARPEDQHGELRRPYAALSLAWKVQTPDIIIENLTRGMHLCAKGGNYYFSFIDVTEEDQSSSDMTPSKEDKCGTCGDLWPVIFCTFMVMGGRRSARKGEKMRKHPQRYQ